MRLRLSKLRATGTDVEPAEIEFADGLTVISGASNTGKSYIQMCLYYMFGGKKPPKDVDGNDPYHTLLLELTAEASEHRTPFTLQRGLKTGGDVAIHDCAMDVSLFLVESERSASDVALSANANKRRPAILSADSADSGGRSGDDRARGCLIGDFSGCPFERYSGRQQN